MDRPLVFTDCETTGISDTDQMWEFAAIRRELDGTEHDYHAFIEHDPGLCARLPERFLNDHRRRFDPEKALSRDAAALLIASVTGGATLVGACPWFDAGHYTRLLAGHGFTPAWHYRLRCVESMAAGRLGRDVHGLAGVAEAFGIHQPAAHTAMGDVLTTRAAWDAMMKPAVDHPHT